jgi:methionyl-tRNA formyltransferase
MSVVFLGSTKFSKVVLEALLAAEVQVTDIFTLKEEFSISYSKEKVKNYNYANLKPIADAYGIPCFTLEQGKDLNEHKEYLRSRRPDAILVMGWYYMIGKEIREIATHGAWGIHASMLPDYAGGAPLVWAIINGEQKTGTTLFQLSDGVDDGNIIAQQEIEINFTDTIREVYDRVEEVSKQMLVQAVKNPEKIVFTPQQKDRIKVYPQRSPADGELNLQKPAIELYNFIRAQSSPYPGAFIKTVDGKKLIIEKARIE